MLPRSARLLMLLLIRLTRITNTISILSFFSLYVLGSFDDQTAVFKTCAPISLQTASALFASRNVDKDIEHPFDFSK